MNVDISSSIPCLFQGRVFEPQFTNSSARGDFSISRLFFLMKTMGVASLAFSIAVSLTSFAATQTRCFSLKVLWGLTEQMNHTADEVGTVQVGNSALTPILSLTSSVGTC